MQLTLAPHEVTNALIAYIATQGLNVTDAQLGEIAEDGSVALNIGALEQTAVVTKAAPAKKRRTKAEIAADEAAAADDDTVGDALATAADGDVKVGDAPDPIVAETAGSDAVVEEEDTESLFG